MNDAERRAIVSVLLKRQKPQFAIDTFCFKEQIDFINDESQFKTAVCSRRSGKTIACAADLICTAISINDVVCLYITLSRKNAKRIIWPELLKINREFQLNGTPNESDLTLKFPNGSIIYVSGAKDKTEIENFRGLALKKVYVDECQSFRGYIEDLIDDVISKALFDYRGQLCLIGTPGLVPAGYFYKCSTSQAWSHYAWTMFQNPHLERKSGKKVNELVQEDCDRMGVDVSHPKIQRECYGRWIADTESLVFKYDSIKNHYDQVNYSKDWEFVIGVDLGFDDADAIAVIGWHKHSRIAYLIKEDVSIKQGITELSNKINELILEFDPLKVVMDTGGLGLKIAEEMRKRYTLPIVAAEKQRKFEHIEILNDAMRTERFFAKKTSKFAEDSMLVEWDWDKTTPDRMKVSDSYHSDICFVAGTLIETDIGQKPIEQIKSGDLVMTRNGLKRVLSSGMTSAKSKIIQIEFSNGSILRCTPKHPIFTINRGFIAADALLYSDRCDISPKWHYHQQNYKQRLLSSMVLGLHGIQILSASLIETIIVGISVMGLGWAKKPHYIGPFGNSIMVKSRMDIMFTIKTAIHSIMTSLTSSASQLKNTSLNTARIGVCGDYQDVEKSISIKLENSRHNGINLRKDANGIKNMRCIGRKNLERKSKSYALSVIPNIHAMHWPLSLLRRYCIVQINAALKLVVTLKKTMKDIYVRFVRSDFGETNIQNPSFVAVLVRPQIAIGYASVYNLKVETSPEYYANGILVHNCDAVLYAYREALHWLTDPAPVTIKPQTEAWFTQQAKEAEDNLIAELEREKQNDIWADMEWS